MKRLTLIVVPLVAWALLAMTASASDHIDSPSAAQAAAGADAITAISASQFNTCAVKDGGAWCWGAVLRDVPGYGTLVPMAVPGLASGVSAISAGGLNTCALKDGGVWCWGLRPGGPNNAEPVAVSGLSSGVSAISAGGDHVCAVKDGGIWCSGLTGGHDLRPGSTLGSDVAVAVPGLASGVGTISAGDDHVCAVKDGGIWCWGSNFARQLGNNGADSAVPVAVSGLTSGVSAISAGGGYSCAVKDGGVLCWGDNSKGQLGNNNTTDVCGLNFFPCSHAPVAVPGLASGVSAISAGGDHSCALKDDGVWCWGGNLFGQLGNNSKTDSLPVAVSGLASGVSAISASGSYTCALKDDGVLCWGANFLGNLGNNSTTHSPVPVPVLFPPPGAGDTAAAPDARPLSSQPSTDPSGHRTASVLGATAAAALAIVAPGMWAVRRRRIT